MYRRTRRCLCALNPQLTIDVIGIPHILYIAYPYTYIAFILYSVICATLNTYMSAKCYYIAMYRRIAIVKKSRARVGVEVKIGCDGGCESLYQMCRENNTYGDFIVRARHW